MKQDWFINPTSEDRPAPLWVWNDDMTEERIAFELQEMKSHGFGGAFVHPRFGLITPYLSERWFSLWNYSLQTAKQLGLKLYIYDENTYPSGYAGGHVSAMLPDCIATSANYSIQNAADYEWKPIDSKALIRAFSCEQSEGNPLHVTKDVTYLSPKEWKKHGEKVILIQIVKQETNTWLGNFAYVDLLRPEVTEAFLETTYEEYYKRFGESFGTDIPAIFSDEPGVSGAGIYKWGEENTIPFSYWFAAQFEAINGYSLYDHLPAVFDNVTCDWFQKPAEKVRYDFCETTMTLWTQNFLLPMYRWCEEHHIAWTGHYLEEYWPSVLSSTFYGNVMANYEYMQWPAIDMLMSALLKNAPTSQMRMVMLQLSAVGNQLNKQRLLCESYGAGGWEASMEDFKRIGDYLLVNGITFINQHLMFSDLAGSRKRDHPQSFDWRQPWWDDYTKMNDYTSRVTAVLRRGLPENRVLLLHPTTTSYLQKPFYYPNQLQQGVVPDYPDVKDYFELVQKLTDLQIDFDLGDETVMANNAVAEQQLLSIGHQHYRVVIVPGDMKNMKSSTVSLLRSFLAGGGHVIAIGKPGCYVDGEQQPDAYHTLAQHPHWHSLATLAEIEPTLTALVCPYLLADKPLPTGFTHRRIKLEDGSVAYFLVNHAMEKVEAEISLPESSAEKWDLFTGETVAYPFTRKEERITLPIRLERCESLMLITNTQSAPGNYLSTAITSEAEIHDLLIRAEEENNLLIDYCDLIVDGVEYRDIYYLHAADILFKQRGFNGNVWLLSTQYQNRIMSQNRFTAGSGFTLRYHFYADNAASLKKVKFVAERPSHYRISVNGTSLYWEETAWLDTHNGAVDLSAHIRDGENIIEMTTDCFDLLLEPEAAYLRGDFTVVNRNGIWTIQPLEALGIGMLAEQGYPFYSGALFASFSFETKEGEGALLELPQLEACSCTVAINGTEVGIYGVDGKKPIALSPYLTVGKNIVNIRLSTGFRNLFGPHHMEKNQREANRNAAFPAFWEQAPKVGRPLAEEYDLFPYGFGAAPILWRTKK